MSIVHLTYPIYDDGATTDEFFESLGYLYEDQSGEELPEINWPENFRYKHSVLAGFNIRITIDTETGEIKILGMAE